MTSRYPLMILHSCSRKLMAALTAMGLASTSGAIAAKTGGTVLASTFHWRTIARFGCLIALFGSWIITRAPIQPFQKNDLQKYQQEAASKPVGSWLRSAKGSLGALLTSKLFWMLGVAHSMAFVNRGIDRIMGTFFNDITGFSRKYHVRSFVRATIPSVSHHPVLTDVFCCFFDSSIVIIRRTRWWLDLVHNLGIISGAGDGLQKIPWTIDRRTKEIFDQTIHYQRRRHRGSCHRGRNLSQWWSCPPLLDRSVRCTLVGERGVSILSIPYENR